jgi:exodeoxyribonuclease-3
LHNFYVPAGGDIPDPKVNPKFAHKLEFLREMETRFAAEAHRRNDPIVLVATSTSRPRK